MLCVSWEESMGAPYGEASTQLSAPPTLELWEERKRRENTRAGKSVFSSSWAVERFDRTLTDPGIDQSAGKDVSSDKTLCCVEHVDCIVKYYFSCRDIQLLTWTPLGRVSYYSAFSPLLDQKLSSLGRNGFAIIVRWVSWKWTEQWRRSFCFVLRRGSRELRRVWNSDTLSLLWAVITHHTLHHLLDHQRNKRMISPYCGYDYSGENRSSLLVLLISVFE